MARDDANADNWAGSFCTLDGVRKDNGEGRMIITLSRNARIIETLKLMAVEGLLIEPNSPA